MKKLGYVNTSRDAGGPVFFFGDEGNSYRLRLAGNPLLILEGYYNLFGGENFMETYTNVKEGKKEIVDKQNLKVLDKANKACKDLMSAIVEIQQLKKSFLVVYKD